jgi:flagellar hook-associated protein 2
VTQLVTAERNQYMTPITSRESRATVQLSAVSSLKGALSTFQTAVNTLSTSASFSPRATTSSDEDAFTASSASDASTGSYDIQVIALAKAQQLASGTFTDGAASKVGTGTMTITYGAKSFDITLDSTNNTLANVRDAINKASANTGVQATLLNEQGGTRLVLTSAKTGAENTIKIAQTGGDGGLAKLAYDGVNPSSVTQMQGAQDAHIKISNFDHFSATNTITEAIDGVTLNLKTTSTEPVTLAVTEDSAALKQRVSGFVQSYNALYSSMSKLRSYDANTKAAGPLLGDALLRGIESQIGLDLSNPVGGLTGDYKTLASLGITRQTDGTLALDSAKLDKALSADSTSVAKVFGSKDTGVAVKLSKDIATMLKEGGVIDSRNDSLTSDLKTVQADSDALDARMDTLTKRYTKQFTALDTLLTQLQSTSNYLSAQLSSITGG